MQALNSLADLQIVVKPHPGESAEWYRQQIASNKLHSIVLPPRYDTNEAIFACDLFVTVTSTSILEALILGKKVLVVNLTNLPEPLPWVEEGVVTGVYQKTALVSTVKKILTDSGDQPLQEKRRIEFLQKHVFKTNGKATERVAKVINQLIRKNK
jgi:CDP-glycerol glycerophosphotransferase (TagB/SpsB family)